MQRWATKMINDPMFQRHQEAMENDLEQQVHRTIEHKTYMNNVTTMAMEARINRDDMAFLLSHMGQGPPGAPGADGVDGRRGESGARGVDGERGSDGIDGIDGMDGLDGQDAKQLPPPPPPAGAAGATMIKQTSPQIVERARVTAELDGMAQEQARRGAIPVIQRQVEAQLERQMISTPQRALIASAQQLRPVAQAPIQPAEEAYVAPPVRHPQMQFNPYDQQHGPVDPGIKARIQALAVVSQLRPPPARSSASSQQIVPVPPKPKQPAMAPMSDSDKRGPGGGGGGVGKKIRVAADEIVVPPKAKPKAAAPISTSSSDKKGPGGGGGKKLRIVEEAIVKPSKRKTDEEEEEAPPSKSRPKPSSAPVFPSKIRPSKAPIKPSRALAIENDTVERKYVGKTQGKFVKTRRAIPAQPAQSQEADHEFAPLALATRGSKLLSSVASSILPQAALRMRQVLAQLRSTAASTPTGLIMNRMLEQVRRRGGVRGAKALSDRRRSRK